MTRGEIGRKSFRKRNRIAVLILCSMAMLPTFSLPACAQVTVWTQHNDNARTGANTSEKLLSPSNVNKAQFGKLFSYPLDDQTYSQPLYVPNLVMSVDGMAHNVVFVTTVSNSVYAWDADSNTANGGKPLWHENFTPAGTRPPNVQDMDNIGACGGSPTIAAYHDFSGNFGIVGAAVIDTGKNAIYLVARTVESGVFVQRLHALDIRSGNEIFEGPIKISGSYGGVVFDGSSSNPSAAQLQNQRAALTLVNGTVYIAWSSHCDNGDYHGWVMSYQASGSPATLKQVAAWNDSPANDNGGNHGGIWQGGQGATVDGQGALYFLTGNGAFDGVSNFGESAIQLNTSSAGTLRVGQFFTPSNFVSLNAGDTDLGSAGGVLIPGTSLLVGGGKEGMIYVMDTTAMGGLTTGGPDNVVQEFQATSIQNGGFTLHIHGGPVFFNGGSSAQYIYVWGENDFLRAYQYSNPLNAFPAGGHGSTHQAIPVGGLIDSTAVAHSTMTAPQIQNGMPGGFLSTSSNGTSNGIVWALTPHACNANQHVEPGALLAFDATKFAGSGSARTLVDLWDSTQDLSRDDVGYFAKFTYPTVANGKVYVSSWGKVPSAIEDQCAESAQPAAPSNQGQLVVYGLLAAPSSLAVQTTLPVPALTDAGFPNLGGSVISDVLVPFTLKGPTGTALCTGNLQERVVRSTNTSDLDFYYRLRDTSGTGSVAKIDTSSFSGLLVSVGFRTDGLGTVSPRTAVRSAAPGALITFEFGGQGVSCATHQESQFLLISTGATSFVSGGKADVYSSTGVEATLAAVMP
jgi:hypothetical protein